MPTRLLLASLAVLVSFAPASLAAAEVSRTLQLELKGDPGGAFAVENLAGTLSIKTGSGPNVVAVATIHADSDDWADQVRFEQVSGKHGVPTLRVRYPVKAHARFRYSSPGGGFGSQETTVRYDGKRVEVNSERGVLLYADVVVEVPAKTGEGIFINHVGTISAEGLQARRLHFDGDAAQIRLRGLDADVRADTGSGNVEASGIVGRFNCDTGSGECSLEGFDGDRVVCDTGSGDIDIRSARAERIEADTGSGDIDVRASQAEHFHADTGSGDIQLETAGVQLSSIEADTGSGDVTLALGADAAFELRADTGSGRIESGYSDAEPIRRHKEIIGYRRGDAHIKLTVDTGSGDVQVRP